jgi:serine/threonine protein kinase
MSGGNGSAVGGAVNRTVAGRYRLHELIGKGGMGAVWRATDELLGRTVALKQVRLDGLPAAEAAVARERTMREARIAAALHHPHVVTVFDVVLDKGGDGDGEPWLVMEYVPARSLGSVLAERGALPPAEVAMIGAQVASALGAAHASGIVHRDVKPDNVLVIPSPAGLIVKLTDFGISHAAAVPALTATGILTGTPAYFAPETARGEQTDARSDMYSLGATLYTAVEGHPPFGFGDDNLLAFLARVGRGGPPPPRQAGPLTGLLRDLVADAPAARPTAVQAARALYGIVASTGRQMAPTTAFEPPRRGRRSVAIAGAALVAAAAVVATVLVVGSGTPTQPAPQAAPTTPVVTTPATRTPANASPGPLSAERTADPCSLLHQPLLERYGSTTIDTDNGFFRECTAFVAFDGGENVAVRAQLFNGPETQRAVSGWSPPQDGPRLLAPDEYADYCDQRVLHPDGSSVLVLASAQTPRELCPLVTAVAEDVASRLVDPGIGQRVWPAESVLATRNACDLVTPDEAARITGITPARSWPGFGGFSCQWGLPDSASANVTVTFLRRPPFDAVEGEAVMIGSTPGRRFVEPGNWCEVNVQQREYVDTRGFQTIELVRVNVYGPEPETCAHASEMAGVVNSRLGAA